MSISNISIVCDQGAECFRLGQVVNGVEIARIDISTYHYDGEPHQCYRGFSEGGEVLFHVAMNCPVVIQFLPDQKP